MKLHLNLAAGRYSFSSHGEDHVEINGVRYNQSLVITPQALHLEQWQGVRFASLDTTHFERLAALQPEMVLLGTGARQCFPHPRLSRALHDAQIGLDVMDTGAACRTYNVLLAEAEERKVAALILF